MELWATCLTLEPVPGVRLDARAPKCVIFMDCRVPQKMRAPQGTLL